MKNASTLSNQDVSREAETKHNKTRAELLSEIRRNLDWLSGAFGVPLDDTETSKEGAR